MNKSDYDSYMDHITFDEGRHQRLMDTLRAGERVPRRPWARAAYGLIAAVACLALVFASVRLLAPGGTGEPTLDDPTRQFLPGGAPTAGLPSAGLVPPTPAPGKAADDPYVLSPADPFDGQAHSSPAILGVEFDSDTPQVSARIIYPDGWFEQRLTAADMVYLLGGEDAEDVPWMLYWTGYDVTGKAIYDGSGQLWQIRLFGLDRANEHNTFTLKLAPGQLPPDCCVDPRQTATELRGIQVYGSVSGAYGWRYDRIDEIGEIITYPVYQIALLNGGAGLCFSSYNMDETTAAHLATQAANVFTYENAIYLDRLLTCAGEIPAWRSEALTLDQARTEEGYGPYVAQVADSLPTGFAFESAHRELGQNRDYLTLSWTGYYTCVSAQFYKVYDLPNGVMDVNNKAYYDERLYTVPYADSVPDEVMFGGFQDPVFHAADLSPDVMEARILYKGELEDWQSMPLSAYRAGLRGNFSVLYPDGVLGRFSFSGVTPAEALAMVGGSPDTVHLIPSVRVYGAGGSSAELPEADAQTVLTILGIIPSAASDTSSLIWGDNIYGQLGRSWAEGTADCASDYSLRLFDNLWLNYHSDCGTFNDTENNRSFKLSAADRETVNAILSALGLPTRSAPEAPTAAPTPSLPACGVDGCTISGAHSHHAEPACGVAGCTIAGEHSHHTEPACGVAGCTIAGEHSHHAEPACGVAGCTISGEHSHSSGHHTDGHHSDSHH